MCGIVGWVSRDTPIDPPSFERMTDRLAHRGPDGRGTWYSPSRRTALGHRRLAIVDLSPAGAQPMPLAEAGLWLTYNGEIYNHAALRRELEGRGHVYRSRSDSETILHAYAEWGGACVSRLRGIFAFAIWDERRQTLFAARDHVGVKPFYYHTTPEGMAFASQPRAFFDLPRFQATISHQAFADYLAYGIVPGERGAHAGISKLLPGHTLTWSDGAISLRRYWRLPESADIHCAEQAALLLGPAIEEAVDLQLMSDVPVATFLSGGINSSLVTAIGTTLRSERTVAFTMGFDDERRDERPFAAKTAEYCGADAVVGVLTEADADGTVDDTVEAFDEPFGIGAALPMVAISRLAAEHSAKVVLTGDGADELFAGYRHYDTLAAHYRRWGQATGQHIGNWPRHWLMRAARGRFDPMAKYSSHNAEIAGSVREALAGEAMRDALVERWREVEHFPLDREPVEAARRCDFHTYLPDEILVKVDRATMAFGIEARVPFVDPELAALAFRIASILHYERSERKGLLKRVARRWLSDEILTARKKGFSAPLGAWFNAPAARHRRMVEALMDGKLVASGLLRREAIEPTLRALRRPAAGLLQLYLGERWANRWCA